MMYYSDLEDSIMEREYKYSDTKPVSSVPPHLTSKHYLLPWLVSLSAVVLVFISIWMVGFFYSLDLLDAYVPEERSFSGNVNIFDIMEHLRQFESIAQSHQNSRAIDLGYNASVSYVVGQLSQYDDYFTIQQQVFPVTQVRDTQPPQLQQISPASMNYVLEEDFRSISYSGSGNVQASVTFVSSGCANLDYENVNFQTGDIALAMYTSDCNTATRSQTASTMGAGGLLIYDDEAGLFSSSAKSPMPIPIFAVSHELGTEIANLLATNNPVTMQMISSTEAYDSYTINIIADTKKGDDSNVIVSGSHLDSVPAGPGINDNGSGSASNLEIALQFARNKVNPVNKVRFAWWAAEELGLKGSTYYVNNLANTNSAELKKIAMNANYDMLGSPNFSRAIYNGTEAKDNIRAASITIMRAYQQFFDKFKLAWELTPFTGRSDYGPFLDYDIPAGGLFSGAEVKKDMNQRAIFGGVSNAPFDSCYHQSCDTVDNINREGLDQMAKAAANVVYTFAMQQNLRQYLSGQ